MPPTPESPRVRPLSGAARWLLAGTTALTIGLFYVFVCLAALLGLIWLSLVFLCFIALVRFGLGGLILKYLERDVQLLLLLARALWLNEAAAYRLPLARDDAPRLFELLDRLAQQMAVRPPDELCLELSCGAWVEMRGLKSGLGTTRVGVGYDLLAGLTEQEVAAVMAHELAHAKLIGRFFHNRLRHGMNRSIAVTGRLGAFVDAYRRAGESAGVASLILAGADRLTALCARQMGAYSRQGEFEADQGAAQLCGSAPLRSALKKLPALDRKLSRLPWNERVGKIESPEGLASWLLAELATVSPPGETAAEAPFDRYSTHPPLPDRLAALPEDGSILPESPPGLGLLADPDAVALKLVGAIEETAARQEAKDLAELRKWLRKARNSSPTHIRLRQIPGGLLVVAGLFVGIAMVGDHYRGWVTATIVWATTFPLGVWLYRLGYYRDPRSLPLPVPAFADFMVARQHFPIPDIQEAQRKIEGELKDLMVTERREKRAVKLVEFAYAELARGGYLRAHVAARMAQDYRKNWVPRDLAMMIAAAAFDQADTANQLLRSTLTTTRLRTASTLLAAGWALMLMGAWQEAEAVLRERDRRWPGSADIQALLALCAARRGKMRTATKAIRAVCEPRAPSPSHLKLLVELLLSGGALREAGSRLAEFDAAAAYDPDVVHFRIQYRLLRREFALADQELAMLGDSQLSGSRLLAIGYLYENARDDERAVGFFDRASAKGHYPEALLALAAHALDAGNRELARTHLHKAFDSTTPLAEKAASIYQLLPRALALLHALEPRSANCRAWVAHALPGKDTTMAAKHSWIVFAADEQAAATYLQNLLLLLSPNQPPVPLDFLNVIAAPHNLHPVRPVHPGIQYVYQ
ncbi:MAG TPA: M48 family metalloprotease [Lacunisphaera sp.]|nr:M48 family metalloprotease [Lacunisphaera sp.]